MSNHDSYKFIDTLCECGAKAASGCGLKCPLCYWEDEASRLYQEIETALKILLKKKRVEYAQGYDLVKTATETMAKLDNINSALVDVYCAEDE